MAARRSARNSPCAKEAQEGVKGGPSPGVPPLRAASAARSPCDLRTPAVIRRRAGVEPRPYRGLAERGRVGGGRRKGSSRTPTPTAGGKRAMCRIIYRETIPRPGGGRWNAVGSAEAVTAGRRGRRPLRGWCGDVGPAVISGKGRRGRRPLRVPAGRAACRGIFRVRVTTREMVKTPPVAAF